MWYIVSVVLSYVFTSLFLYGNFTAGDLNLALLTVIGFMFLGVLIAIVSMMFFSGDAQGGSPVGPAGILVGIGVFFAAFPLGVHYFPEYGYLDMFKFVALFIVFSIVFSVIFVKFYLVKIMFKFLEKKVGDKLNDMMTIKVKVKKDTPEFLIPGQQKSEAQLKQELTDITQEEFEKMQNDGSLDKK